MLVLRPVISYLVKNNNPTVYFLLFYLNLCTLKKSISCTVNENWSKIKNPLYGKNNYIIERHPPIKSTSKSGANHRKFITNTKNCAISVLCVDEKGVEKFVAVTRQKDVEDFKNPVKRNSTDSGLIKNSPANPFERNFCDMQDNGENLTIGYASLSPDQKKAFKDAVL